MTEHTNKASEAARWSEIEHLPEWDEEFYDVYTAKKLGKWVMLKTLKPAYKDDPRFASMIEKEFDVRYNLAHPNIVMTNDFEDVPGLGRCIVFDDVYGTSLRKILDEGKLTRHHVEQVKRQLVDAIEYIQLNHIVHFPIRPETIIFTENVQNLKLIDVGFDQRECLTPSETTDDIYNYGKVLSEVIKKAPEGCVDGTLKRVADKCCQSNPRQRYRNIYQLRMALAHRNDNKVFLAIVVFLLLMVAVLGWLSSKYAPL